MRKLLLTVVLAFGGLIASQAQTPITNNEAGKLKSLLDQTTDLSDLSIGGVLNADDFAALRATAGVKKLNLAQVEIVPGGSYEVGGYTVETKQKVFPAYFLFQAKISETLENITLPSNVTTIDSRALNGGIMLEEIELPYDLQRVHDMAFGECSKVTKITLPETVTFIGASAFNNCSALESIELPEDLEQLGEGAFENCTSIESVTIPAKIKELGAFTFKGCSGLTEIKFPIPFEKIGTSCFENCVALETVTLPPLLNSLGKGAFKGCTTLTTCTFGNHHLQELPEEVFRGCTSLESIVLPATMTYVGPYAFAGCTALNKVVLPTNLTTLMGGAFANTALTTVMLPDKVEAISFGAFAHCTDLEHVLLPTQLKDIADKAFGGCDALKSLTIKTANVPTGDVAGLNDLAENSELVLYVPEGAVKNYSEANGWKQIKNIRADKLYTVELTEEVNLEKAITDGEFEPAAIALLKIKGILTEEDPETLASLTRIRELDLSELDITASGDTWDELVLSKTTPLLQKVTLPKGYTCLSRYLLSHCFELREVVATDPLKELEEQAFLECSSLTTLPDLSELETMGEEVFMYCGSIKVVTLPNAIEILPDYTFFGCSSLEKVSLGEEMAELGEYSFSLCDGLKELTLPAPLNEIKGNVFLGCRNLAKLTFLGTETPVVEEDSFMPYHFEKTALYLPSQEVINKFKSAKIWKLFKLYSVASATTPMTLDEVNVQGTIGGIRVVTSDHSSVEIFTVMGARVSRVSVSGEQFIALPAGTYIVTIGNQATKVIVL